jgi:hypothetical protein
VTILKKNGKINMQMKFTKEKWQTMKRKPKIKNKQKLYKKIYRLYI